MKTKTLKRLTIIAEAVVAEEITAEILRHGATGYTITEAEGQGSRGIRASEWEGKNIKIETLARAEVADSILTTIADRYFKHYAVVAYMHDVEVVRGEKYE